MHFPIICLTHSDDPEKFASYQEIEEDGIIQANTDYVGKKYSKEDRRRLIIESDYLKNVFRGIATINPEEETLTFLPDEQIRETLHNEYKYILELLQERLDSGRFCGWDLRDAGNIFRGCEYLFYVEDCGLTSMRLVENAIYYTNKTFYFGNVYDAHF